MIPESFVSTLLERADIVDVIGRYLPLKKKGSNWMCCCPFHKEKTPSFSVSPAKQFFHCFGCGEHGDAIGFLMKYEGLEFPDAVRRLAGFYGMEVPEDASPAQRRERRMQKTLGDYMAEAAAFYTQALRGSPKAIDYLKGRQISAETAERFGLGYSPEGWHALQSLFGEKYGDKALLECGLVNEKNGRRYDAFRDRIMYPIRNAKGMVIGFGARTMKGDKQPKYLNSPETPIYHKGSELYGAWEGRDAIREKNRAIVCEGYMDVIQLSQAGFREAVAALGTSITSEHVRKLFKLTDTVYFSFDGDGAGRKAARRALEAALPVISDTQKAFFVILPPEHDPDSLIKAEGPEGYERELEKAYSLTEFLRRSVTEGKELMYAEERAKAVAEAKPLVLSMQHAPILRLAVIRELAAIARLTPEDIERQYGLARPAPQRPAAPQGGWQPAGGGASRGFYRRDGYWRPRGVRAEPPAPVRDIRERLLQCFLSYPQLIAEFSAMIEESFLESRNPLAQQIVEVWRAAGDAEEDTGAAPSAAALLSRLAESPNAPLYERLLSEELTTETPEQGARLEVRRAFAEMALEDVKARIDALSQDPAADKEQIRALMTRRSELRARIAAIQGDEHAYRLGEFEKARREQRSREAKSEGDAMSAQPLSKNPAVAALQKYLMGETKAEAQGLPKPAAAPKAADEREALRREIAARRAAAPAAAPAAALSPEAAEPDDELAAANALPDEGGVPEMPDVPEGAEPDDDDVPFEFDDGGSGEDDDQY